jgi:hypothetical protein
MINYKNIQDSIEFYEKRGFKRVESPWTVTKAISDITKPVFGPGETLPDFTIKEKNKVLVASGEQSFLYLYNKGFLPKGQFQTVTPCFREDSFDSFHTKYFLKNELIKTDQVDEDSLDYVLGTAFDFFQTRLGDRVVIQTIVPGREYDISFDNIELGSYGIRSCDFLSWVYATGVAEPRLSRVMEKYGIPQK